VLKGGKRIRLSNIEMRQYRYEHGLTAIGAGSEPGSAVTAATGRAPA
jgi:hypothetical protein